MIIAAPLCHGVWIAALALVGLSSCLFALRRRAPGALWRGLAIGLLVLVLINPEQLRNVTKPLPDTALIVVDHSDSMAIGDRARLTAAALASLQASHIQTRVVDVATNSDGTDLFATLNDALQTMPRAQLAGVIAITDGEVADAPHKLGFRAPFSVLIPAAVNETDRELRLLRAPRFGLVGETAELSLEIIDHGVPHDHQRAQITVTADGSTIWQQSIAVGRPVSVPIPVRHPGPMVISAQVASLPGEVSKLNDEAAFTLNAIQTRLNVLLLSGSPDQSVRIWRNMLLADPNINLLHYVVMQAPGEIMSIDPQENAMTALPAAQIFGTDIGKLNLIILDRLNPTGLLSAQDLANIALYVQHGGALLDVAGPEFSHSDSLAATPLGVVLPAAPSGPHSLIGAFTPRVTALGARAPVSALYAHQPLAPWYRMQAAKVSQGEVLMKGAHDLPLLVLAKPDHGRVGMLLSDQSWLWNRDGGAQISAVPLLLHTVRWLLDDPAMQGESLAAKISDGQLIITRQSLKTTPSEAVDVTDPAGRMRVVTLHPTSAGLASASLPADLPGMWQVSAGDLHAFVLPPVQNPAEFRDLAATDKILAPLARHLIWLGKTPDISLPPLLQSRHARMVVSRQATPIMPPFLLLLAALGLMVLAWWQERG